MSVFIGVSLSRPHSKGAGAQRPQNSWYPLHAHTQYEKHNKIMQGDQTSDENFHRVIHECENFTWLTTNPHTTNANARSVCGS